MPLMTQWKCAEMAAQLTALETLVRTWNSVTPSSSVSVSWTSSRSKRAGVTVSSWVVVVMSVPGLAMV